MKDHFTRKVARFGVFEADLEAGELRKGGIRVKLQEQPFRVLELMLKRPGEVVTRDEIVQELWGNDTYVDFDQSVGAVIRRLRRALGDSATTPRYIETLRHKGYRFLAPIQTSDVADSALPPLSAMPEPQGRGSVRASYWVTALATVVLLALAVWGGRTSGSIPGNGQVPLAQRARNEPRNIGAYLACQKGRYLWKMRTAPAVESSIGYFQQALKLDPNYAPAYAGLADAYAVLNFYTGRQGNAPIERARAANRQALKLDRSLAEAHATEAYLKFYYEWDWEGAERTFRKAIDLNPEYATAHQWYAEYLFYMERFEEADREINRAHELDPQSTVISLQLASPYLFSKRYVQAMEKIREALKLNPESPLGSYMLATCYEQLGRFDEAIEEYRKIEGTKMGLTGLGYAYGRSGRRTEARQILRRLLGDTARDDLSAYHVARVYAGLNDAEQTFEWLKKALRARDERMVMVRVDPKLDGFRSNPRFRELLRGLGLV